MTDFSVRFATVADAPSLLALEKTYFPAVAGQHHAGYLYSDAELITDVLNEALAAPLRAVTLVAEQDGKILGFAASVPWSFPGTSEIDPAHVLLQYLAVDPDARRSGVGSALLSEIERRALAARQNMIVAHVPKAAAAFYEAAGWRVLAEDHGFAWLPFGSRLRADMADAPLGFPLMSAKTLRARAIRHTFDFKLASDRPLHDAATDLMNQIDAGSYDVENLDEETRQLVQMARKGPPPKEVLAFFDKLSGRGQR